MSSICEHDFIRLKNNGTCPVCDSPKKASKLPSDRESQAKLKQLVQIERAKRSFERFVELAWDEVEPARKYVSNGASKALIKHLQAVGDGRIKRLVIAIPPGSGKSTLCGVLFPAWQWARKPAWRVITASHAHSLAVRDSLRMRRLIESEWYRERFAINWKLREDQNRNDDFENTLSGRRLAVGVGGALTGSRANCAIIDDSLNAVDANSSVEIAKVNEWFDQALSTRLDDPDNASIVVIQQRLHDNDLIGHLTRRGGFELLVLPAEYDPERPTKTSIWQDERTESGQILAPEIHSARFLAEQRKVLGSFGYANQYQQSPIPQEGGIFKLSWFKYFDEAPKFEEIVISVDCAAKQTTTGSNTAILVGGRKDANRYLLDLVVGHFSTSETVTLIKTLAAKYNPSRILVEEKAAGPSVIEHLKTEFSNIIPINPGSDSKESRAMAIQPQVEAGSVLLLKGAPWVDEFLAEVCAFPKGSKDDRVDTMTQLLNYWRVSGGLLLLERAYGKK
jgi:predicted phage terminase large subunit-like protein